MVTYCVKEKITTCTPTIRNLFHTSIAVSTDKLNSGFIDLQSKMTAGKPVPATLNAIGKAGCQP